LQKTLLSGCTEYVKVPVVETLTETVLVTETVVETEYIEDTERIDELEEEVLKYQELIGNLNELLSYIYPMRVSNDNYSSDLLFKDTYVQIYLCGLV